MRTALRYGFAAIVLSMAFSACTPGTAAGGLADDTISGGPAVLPPNGPSEEGSPGAAPPGSPITGGTHRYQTTASVGDFLQITIDKSAHTASYVNKTNGLRGEGVPFTVDAKGVYAFTDPNGHVKSAIELEDYALIVDVDKAGPKKDSRALAIGAATLPISLADLAARKLNMMQLRTKSGGMEIGNVILGTEGNALTVDLQRFWPRGAMSGDSHAFHVGSMGKLPIAEAAGEHEFFSLSEMQGGLASTDYVFRTATGLAIDMSNGNMVMLEQPAMKDFDATTAGAYRALAFVKQNAHDGPDDASEPGMARVTPLDVTISASGHVKAVDDGGIVLLDDYLTPVADAPHLTGVGKLDPERSKGIFTFRSATSNGNRDVFVIFTMNGLLFSTFTPGAMDSYEYVYGAAVKQK